VLSSLRAELLILVRWRTAKVFLLITPAYAFLTGYAMQFLFFKTADTGTFQGMSADQILPTMMPADFATVALNNFGSNVGLDPTMPFLLFGALVAGSDWGTGTITTALLQGPSRTRTVLGQSLAVLLALAATTLATFATCATASALVALTQTGSLSSSSSPFPSTATVAAELGSALLVAFTYGAAGLALGSLLRNAGAAIAVVLLWTVIVTPTLDMVGLQFNGALHALYRALPDPNALTLTHMFGTVALDNPVATVAPSAAVGVLILYTVAFLTLPALVVRRRNIA
jgi:hypothetical protein